jgi:hypothetical protein
MTVPVYHIYVDFDCANWAGAHDFTTLHDEITGDVKHFRINRGKDKDSNTYPAATLEMILENSSGKYYPTATTGDYVGKVRLWLPVKVTAVYGGTTYGLFYGYINRITAYPIKNRQDIYFYATDGIDLLTKQIVVQDMDDKTIMNDGEAVNQVLNAANWRTPDVACTFQNAGDTVTKVSHGFTGGERVMFSGASIPVAVDPLVSYYVVNPVGNTFQISLTLVPGTIINFAGDGSGYYHQILRRAVDVDGGDITNFPDTFEFSKPT